MISNISDSSKKVKAIPDDLKFNVLFEEKKYLLPRESLL